MKGILLLLLWQLGVLAGVHAFADVITLKDGRQFFGLIQSGNTQEVRIQAQGHTEVIALEDIQSIRFGSQEVVAPKSSPAPALRPAPAEAPVPRPAPAPTAAAGSVGAHTITLPVGTEIAVRTLSALIPRRRTFLTNTLTAWTTPWW
jgi:hypothetical protein